MESKERHPRPEREIFEEALTRPTPQERAAFLDAACSKDAELRSRLEELLRNHESSGGFMADPAVDVATLSLM